MDRIDIHPLKLYDFYFFYVESFLLFFCKYGFSITDFIFLYNT